jgi:hypothetical protein
MKALSPISSHRPAGHPDGRAARHARPTISDAHVAFDPTPSRSSTGSTRSASDQPLIPHLVAA